MPLLRTEPQSPKLRKQSEAQHDVDGQLEASASKPTANELEWRIARFLKHQSVNGADGLQIKADHGSVEIRGRLANSHDKWKCLTCCKRVAGVIQVKDEIVVEEDAQATIRQRRPR